MSLRPATDSECVASSHCSGCGREAGAAGRGRRRPSTAVTRRSHALRVPGRGRPQAHYPKNGAAAAAVVEVTVAGGGGVAAAYGIRVRRTPGRRRRAPAGRGQGQLRLGSPPRGGPGAGGRVFIVTSHRHAGRPGPAVAQCHGAIQCPVTESLARWSPAAPSGASASDSLSGTELGARASVGHSRTGTVAATVTRDWHCNRDSVTGGAARAAGAAGPAVTAPVTGRRSSQCSVTVAPAGTVTPAS